MLRVTNEIGDFFRVAAKRSLETGRRYNVDYGGRVCQTVYEKT